MKRFKTVSIIIRFLIESASCQLLCVEILYVGCECIGIELVDSIVSASFKPKCT
jgi:hypothetical protein